MFRMIKLRKNENYYLVEFELHYKQIYIIQDKNHE